MRAASGDISRPASSAAAGHSGSSRSPRWCEASEKRTMPPTIQQKRKRSKRRASASAAGWRTMRHRAYSANKLKGRKRRMKYSVGLGRLRPGKPPLPTPVACPTSSSKKSLLTSGSPAETMAGTSQPKVSNRNTAMPAHCAPARRGVAGSLRRSQNQASSPMAASTRPSGPLIRVARPAQNQNGVQPPPRAQARCAAKAPAATTSANSASVRTRAMCFVIIGASTTASPASPPARMP